MTARGTVRRFVVTDHALDRFVERYPGPYLADYGEARRLLLGELDEGIPYGYQIGRDELYLLPSGLVAAVCWDEGVGVIKTVLSREHAIAGMESMGAVLKRAVNLPNPRAKTTPDATTERDPLLEANMRRLAEKHLSEGLNKKVRNALLRQSGYDPAGHAGDLYREAIKAARAAAESDRAPKKAG